VQTGLMRALIAMYYSREQLASFSLNQGINEAVKIAIFSKYCIPQSFFIIIFCLCSTYCELKYSTVSIDKSKRDLTGKCGEMHRKLEKVQIKLV